MHDILRERLIRKIETLPEDQVYQTLDYIEFLEGKYGAEDGEERRGSGVSPRWWRTSSESGR